MKTETGGETLRSRRRPNRWRSQLIVAVCAPLAAINAAPKLADANLALSRSPQAFEPASEPGCFVTRSGVETSVDGLAMGPHSMRLTGADPRARGVGEEPLPGKSHYFIGNDPRKWRINVPHYARVRYRNVYPGIDVVYYGSGRDVEFDFILAPGADPRRIQVALSGPELKLREPRIYQGERIVEGRAVRERNRVTFELAAYDRSHPLVIDPVIGFATLTGGASDDHGVAIAVDRSGAAYVTGTASAAITSGVTPNGVPGGPHAFVTKLSADGSTVLYNAYLGGTGQDIGFGFTIAVDATGNAYVAGQTYSSTFPVVNPAQGSSGGIPDGFVSKLSPDGSTLLFSAYLGGTGADYASGIAIDSAGNAYVTGATFTDDFPTSNAFQTKRGGSVDAFVTKLSAVGSLVFSTYLGGKADDGGQSITVDSNGNVYVTGYTWSTDFPVKDAVNPVNPGGGDAFIVKLAADGSSLVWSTFLGGTGFDIGNSLAVDGSGNVFVAGTTSSNDLPTVNGLQAASPSAVLRKSVDGGAALAASDAGLLGPVSALAIDPVNGSNVYAAVLGNVYKSTDAGRSWAKSLDDPAISSISQIAIDPCSPSTVYAGSAGVISSTTDGGATWKSIKYGGATVLALAVSPKNSTVYAGSGGGESADGLYQSTDGGATWTRPSFSGARMAVKALAIAPSSPSILYANAANALVRSTDGGGSWTTLKTPFSPYTIHGSILVDPSNSALLYAAGFPNPGSGSARIYKSSDAGQSWLDTGFSPTGLPSGSNLGPVALNALAIDGANPATLYAVTSAGLFKTTDGFEQSQLVNPSGNVTVLVASASAPGTLYAAFPATRDGFVARLNADGTSYGYVTYLGGNGDDSANSIAVDPGGNAYVVGSTASGDFPTKNTFADRSAASDGFVAKLSADGATLAYSSLVGAAVKGIALDTNGAGYLTGSWTRPDFFSNSPLLAYHSDTIFRTDDGATNWGGAAFPTNYIGYLAPDPLVAGRVFAVSNGVYRSLDAGRNWTLVQSGQSSGALAIDPVNAGTLWYSQFSGVYKSTDGGDNWHLTKGLELGGGPSIVVDPRNPSILYVAGLFNGRVPVFKSTDGGETWTPLAFGTPQGPIPFPLSPNLLAIDSQSTLYALLGNGLFKSSDGGVTFTQLTGAPSPAYLVAVDPATPSIVYLGGPSGFFCSTNGGATFSKIHDTIGAFAIDPVSPATLYLSDVGPGVLKSTDRGATWKSTGLSNPYVTYITVDPSTPGRVYASTALDPSDVFVIKVVE